MYVLTFDLSSTTVGYTIFNKENKELIKIDYLKYPENLELLDKGRHLEDEIAALLKLFPLIDEFVIEERLKKFQSGKSSADNILVLAQLNYICQYLIKYRFKLKITEINVLKARGLVFPEIFKVTKSLKIKQKDFVFDRVLTILDNNLFPKKIITRGINKGQEVFLEEAKDMADSWLIGQAYFNIKNVVEKPKKHTTKKKK